MKLVPLYEVASVIRSKNSGPYELTFDIIIKDANIYRHVKKIGFFNPQLFAQLYRLSIEDIISYVEFDQANAIKCTIKRPRVAGNIGETDVYGAQQHAPLINLRVPVA